MRVGQGTFFGFVDHKIGQNGSFDGYSLVPGCSATGSMQNRIAMCAKVGSFDFTVGRRQFTFAIIT